MLGIAPAHAGACSTAGGYYCITITLNNQNANFPGTGNTLYVTLTGTQDGALVDSAGNVYPQGTSMALPTSSGVNSFTLQTLQNYALASGRLYFSNVSLTNQAQPGPNETYRYDYVEITVVSNSGAVNGDVTAIDQLGVPASMSFEDANGNVLQQSGGGAATRSIGCWTDIKNVVESSALVSGVSAFTTNFEIFDGSGQQQPANRIRLAGPTWGPVGIGAWPSMKGYITNVLAGQTVRVRGYFAGNSALNEAPSPYDYSGTFDTNGNLALAPTVGGTNDLATETIYLPGVGFYGTMNGTTWYVDDANGNPQYGAGYGVYLQNGPYQLGGTASTTVDSTGSWALSSSGTFVNSIGNDIYGWIYGDLVASMANGFFSTDLGMDTNAWNTNTDANGNAFASPQPAFSELYYPNTTVALPTNYAAWDLWQQAIATTSDSYGVSLGDRFAFQGQSQNPDMATIVPVDTIEVTLLANDGCAPALSPSTQTVTTAVAQPVKVMTTGSVPTAPNDMVTFTASGFTTRPTYSLFDASGQNPATLPAGLTFQTNTGTFSGAAQASMSPTTYTISATDTVNTATAQVTLQVVGRTLTPSTQLVTGPINKPLTSKPFTWTGFKKTPTFTTTPALPPGLFIDSTTGIISGTPTTSQVSTTYLVTATDRRRTGTANAQVSIIVTGGPKLTPASQSFAPIVDNPLPATPALTATGFVGKPTYKISPALPRGFRLNGSNGSISGTSSVVQSALPYTITATDASGNTATSAVSLAVVQSQVYALTPNQQIITGAVGQPINSQPMSASGFANKVTYALSSPPPIGMVFDGSTGILSGTPFLPVAATYLITGRGASYSALASISLHVQARPILAPLLQPLSQVIDGKVGTFTTSAAIVPSGFVGPVTYALSSAPPAGMMFNSATGSVSGIPTQPMAQTFTITATGGGLTGKTGLTFNITDAGPPPPAPRSLSPNQQSISGQVGLPMTSATMVASGFQNAVSYTLSDDPPAGMVFNQHSGVLSGTPTQTWAQTYVITGYGETTQATAALTVRVRPAPGPTPSPTPTPTATPTPTPTASPSPTPSATPTTTPSPSPTPSPSSS